MFWIWCGGCWGREGAPTPLLQAHYKTWLTIEKKQSFKIMPKWTLSWLWQREDGGGWGWGVSMKEGVRQPGWMVQKARFGNPGLQLKKKKVFTSSRPERYVNTAEYQYAAQSSELKLKSIWFNHCLFWLLMPPRSPLTTRVLFSALWWRATPAF